jgi:hypothetical protein
MAEQRRMPTPGSGQLSAKQQHQQFQNQATHFNDPTSWAEQLAMLAQYGGREYNLQSTRLARAGNFLDSHGFEHPPGYNTNVGVMARNVGAPGNTQMAQRSPAAGVLCRAPVCRVPGWLVINCRFSAGVTARVRWSCVVNGYGE